MFNFYEKESYNVNIITSWDKSDDIQYIYVEMILCTLHTSWQTMFMYIFVYNCIQWTFSKQLFCRDVQNIGFLYESKKNIQFCKLPYLEGLVWVERWIHPSLIFQCFSTFRDGKKEITEGGEEGENREKLNIKQINLLFYFIWWCWCLCSTDFISIQELNELNFYWNPD